MLVYYVVLIDPLVERYLHVAESQRLNKLSATGASSFLLLCIFHFLTDYVGRQPALWTDVSIVANENDCKVRLDNGLDLDLC